MSKKVQQLIYEKAKKVKPDCCVSKVGTPILTCSRTRT